MNAIKKAMPDAEVLYADDKKHIPYGNREPEEVLGFVQPILEDLIGKGCEIIVIACNTVSTTLSTELRKRLSVPIVALDPMVKTAAAMTNSGVIAVCATPATLKSSRYQKLKQEFASAIKVLEPDCSDWAAMIETNKIDREKVAQRIEAVCDQGADIIVLACTHYHWIEDLIKEIARDRAVVLQPEQPVIAQLKRILPSR